MLILGGSVQRKDKVRRTDILLSNQRGILSTSWRLLLHPGHVRWGWVGKRKRGWSIIEAKQMVKELLKTSSPYDCPKGKPTVIHLNHDAIKSLFQKSSS